MNIKSQYFFIKIFYISTRDKSLIKREDKDMATMLLFSGAISDTYKNTSESISNVKLNERTVIKKSLSALMKQSFFHGANRYGTNFIA